MAQENKTKQVNKEVLKSQREVKTKAISEGKIILKDENKNSRVRN